MKPEHRLWLIPLLMSLVACVTSSLPATPTGIEATAVTEEGPAVEPTYGPGPFVLVPPTGLSELSGYHATLHLSFEGAPAGWSETLELTASPSGRALIASIEGDAPAATLVEPWSAETNGVYYLQSSDGQCTANAVDTLAQADATPLVWEPADFLPAVIGADEAGADSINGVAARHYTFDERALGVAGIATASGEVWVAEPSGYVVKYGLTLTGGPEYFGEGGEGTLTWEYDLMDADQPTAITLPDDCPAGLVDAPLLDDAQDVQHFPGATLYTTLSDVAAVIAFYQEQLPSAGWEPVGTPITDQGITLLQFIRNEEQLTVVISAGVEGEATSVQLLLGKPSEGEIPVIPTP